MTGEAMDYIQEKGFEHRTQGKEIVLRQCPFCGDKKDHFYLEPKEGLFFCHKCQEAGNLITLQKHLGDYAKSRESWGGNPPRRPQGTIKEAFPQREGQGKAIDEKSILQAHERLLGDAEAMAYVEGRRITPGTVTAFKLGLQVDQEGRRWLNIPHYSKGKAVNIKSRTLPPAEKDFKRVKDRPSILFNGDALEGVEEVFLCEGEIDTLTLWQEGIKNAAGVTVGSGSFLPEWVDQLRGVKKIILCYDPDAAGQKGAREVARRLGYDRVFNILLSGGDINEYFQNPENDISSFQELANKAKRFDVSGILSLEDAFQELQRERENPEASQGLLTPWDSVNRRIKTGFRPGELIVLSAPPKTGKTTLALQICTHNALQGIPSLFFCLEMTTKRIVEKIIQAHCQDEEPGANQIEQTWKAFQGKPLYLGYCYQQPTLSGILETLRAAIQRYGLKLVVFDHLHFLCRSITNQTQEVSQAVQAFKFLAEEMEVPIILLAQPRKINPDAIMTAMDLKDSISIFSDCDHLIILHRKRRTSGGTVEERMETQDQAFEPITLVRVEASRYGPGGEALLYFHGECSYFGTELVK
jgi:replicative DNA helicase